VNIENLREFVALEKKKAELNREIKQTQKALDALDTLLTQQLLDDGVQSVNVDGRTVYLRRDLYASALDGDRAAVVQALKDSGLSQYVSEQYNTNSLSAYVREVVREAEERARVDGGVLEDPATAIPNALAATLKVTAVYSVSSVRS
jgi:hypothetical protein